MKEYLKEAIECKYYEERAGTAFCFKCCRCAANVVAA